MIRVRTLPLVLLFVALLAAVLAGALAAIPGQPAAAVEAPAPAPALSEPLPAAAFVQALFGPGTDVEPAQAAALVELGQRYCTFVVRGEIVPGAEVQTREDWAATLTSPVASPTTGWSPAEADGFFAAAEATLCGHPAA